MIYYREPDSLFAYTDSYAEELQLTVAEIVKICEDYQDRLYSDTFAELLNIREETTNV